MMIIEVKNVEKSYPTGHIVRKKITALRGVTFSVKEGETFGLLGHNGAGKTTLLKLLTGLIHPDSGEVSIFGESPSSLRAKQKIGFLPENPYFYTYLTPREILTFYGELFSISGKDIQNRVEDILKTVNLSSWADIPIKKFSKGMIQRVGVAQALINDPELLILDEPMTGLDPVGRKELKEIILSLKEHGKTIIFSSHILSDVEMICDRVAILIKGKIVEEGDIESLTAKHSTGYEIEIPKKYLKWVEQQNLHFKHQTNSLLLEFSTREEADKFLKELLREDIEILSFCPRRILLEDLFMEGYRRYAQD